MKVLGGQRRVLIDSNCSIFFLNTGQVTLFSKTVEPLDCIGEELGLREHDRLDS